MVEYLESIDQQLFLYLNHLNHPFFDEIMRLITYRFTWIPLYIFLAYLAFVKTGFKHFLLILFSAVLLVTLSDLISVHLFKNVFLRYRPCHNELLKIQIHLIDGCGGLYGFVSSHAANTFAIAVFMGLILNSFYSKTLYFMLTWAFLVSYSRIYAGVHYPADIFFGGLLGCFLALIILRIYKWLEMKLL